MIVKRTFCVVLGLLLLVGIAAAVDISASTISSSNTGWLVVNGGGIDTTATITVTALTPGSPATPVSGAVVTFVLNPASTASGSFSQGSVTTGTDGKATTVYSTGSRSGNAVIDATITYSDGSTTPLTLTVTQKINHRGAIIANNSYAPIATAGSITPLSFEILDIYNNPVDNKNPADYHPIILDTTTTGGSGFFNSSSGLYDKDHIELQPDANGKATINYRLSSIAGKNIFLLSVPDGVTPPYGITYQYNLITGVGNSTAVYLTQSYPSPSVKKADGLEYFTIDYFIYDENGNPSSTALLFKADDGTTQLKTSNPATGKVRVWFGPKTIIGKYTLTATTPSNASVLCMDTGAIGSCSQYPLEFYETDAVDMYISASPQSMGSLDTDPSTKSVIRARVVDKMGNPVAGAVVNFTNATPTYPGGPFNETVPLHLSSSSASVSNGFATIDFTPGAFATYGTPGYNATATGQVVVTAEWINMTGTRILRNTTLVWKNYPYLSIGSDGACSGAQVGQAFNVSISLKGDGAALRPRPIDAMMITDISTSMTSTQLNYSTPWPYASLYGNPMPGPDGDRTKLYYARKAGSTFISKMNPSTDKIGLVTFCGNANVKYSLTPSFNLVNTSLWSESSCGSTNTRTALQLGINDTVVNSVNPKAIKAIILLTDGAYNSLGDPLARNASQMSTSTGGSWPDGGERWYQFPSPYAENQNMAAYAQKYGIKIYTITFGYQADQYNSSATYEAMDLLSSQTGGTHYHAYNGADVISIYETIAGLLQDTAGGDTQVALNFGTVNINDNLLDTNISYYMNYTYYHNTTLGNSPFDSTYTNRTKMEDDGTTTLVSESIDDQTSDWVSKHMDYNVGTVKLNESWNLNFRLKLNQTGNIKLFGPDQPASKITFKDSVSNTTQTAFIPEIQCNIIDKQSGNKGDANLTIEGLQDSGSLFTNSWPISWTTNYNGSVIDHWAWEDVYYINWNNQIQGWKQVTQFPVMIPPESYQKPDSVLIDTSDDTKFPPGDKFCVKVVGTSEDVNGEQVAMFCNSKTGSGAGQYIKLE